MRAENRPVERPWWRWFRDVAVVAAATAAMAVVTRGFLWLNAAFADYMFSDRRWDRGEQYRHEYAADAFYYLTSGQWVGLLVPLIVGAVLMFLHGRTARVLPLALLVGAPLALAQAAIALPAGLDRIDALYADAYPLFVLDEPVPPPPWGALGYGVLVGLLGFPLAAGFGAALMARHRAWMRVAPVTALWLIAWCPVTSLLV